MRKLNHIIFALCSVVPCAYASQAAINNVQNYSSNQFYKNDAVYNQKFPSQVYLKGPSLSASECMLAVNSAIWTQCSFRNNCNSVSLQDIKPGVLMELANKADNNYNSCTGYIDGAFAQFKEMVRGSVVHSDFPSDAQPSNYGTSGTLENPFTYWNQVPDYEYQQKARQYQLENIQRQNDPLPTLQVDSMPETFSDVGFKDRMNVIKEGWQDPAVNKYPTYGELRVENDADKTLRLQALKKAQEAIDNPDKTQKK
jgi:hypothetical protein